MKFSSFGGAGGLSCASAFLLLFSTAMCQFASKVSTNDNAEIDSTHTDLDDELLSAAKLGDVKRMGILIGKGANIIATNGSGNSVLDLAARNGQSGAVEFLLSKGVSANAKSRGVPALNSAAIGGEAEVVKLLLAKGADIGGKDSYGDTALFDAIKNRKNGVVDVLIAAESTVEAKSNYTSKGYEATVETPLLAAARMGDVRSVKSLIGASADVNVANVPYLETPLHFAAYRESVEMARMLLERGARVHVLNKKGNTPLHGAAMRPYTTSSKEQTEIANLLLAKGATLEAKNNAEQTPLHVAASSENPAVAKLLLERGANANAVANEVEKFFSGEIVDAAVTPLHLAARKGEIDMVWLLLSHGACVNATTQESSR